MDLLTHVYGEVVLLCVQKGDRPKWLIHTGTHGNEAEVIESVRKYLESHWNEMPDFLWVIAVSPSAVELKNRDNKYGHNLNRMFRDGTTDPEALANLTRLEGYAFEVFVSVHEDPDFYNAFYLYDSYDMREDERLKKFFQNLFSGGVHAYTGIDDAADPILGNYIKDGYHSLEREVEDGTTFDYLYRTARVCGRRLNPEIPGRAIQKTKDFIVAAFFDYLLEWWKGND